MFQLFSLQKSTDRVSLLCPATYVPTLVGTFVSGLCLSEETGCEGLARSGDTEEQ